VKPRSLAVFMALAFATVTSASAQDDEPKRGCISDALGQPVCAPANGWITKDALGQPVCGLGQCLKNALGQYVCSSQPGGYAALNALGRVVCTGGCETASRSSCQRPS
jgi:hypothetical protein